MKNTSAMLQIVTLLVPIVAFGFMAWSSIKAVPDVQAKVSDHDKRIQVMEVKMDFVVDGMRELLKRRMAK